MSEVCKVCVLHLASVTAVLVHLMSECREQTHPCCVCISFLCCSAQVPCGSWILISQRVLLGAAGTGGQAGQAQPWSLVEELALQVSPGQWRESHLHVGLLFSPMSSNLVEALCQRCEM